LPTVLIKNVHLAKLDIPYEDKNKSILLMPGDIKSYHYNDFEFFKKLLRDFNRKIVVVNNVQAGKVIPIKGVKIRTMSLPYFHSVVRTGLWRGRSCFILGGGPSINAIDLDLLKDKYTIGVNRIFERFDPTILFSMDSRFYGWIKSGTFGEDVKKKFEDFPNYKVWVDTHKYAGFDSDIYIVKSAGLRAMTKTLEEGVGHGYNSGYAALNLAICLGANPIYLLGFDMEKGKNSGKQINWHEKYPVQQSDNVYNTFIKNFQWAAPIIKRRGIRVINLYRNSGLKMFPFDDLENVI